MAENNNFYDSAKKGVKERTATIRLRTWTLTLALIVTLVFYIAVSLTLKNAMNPVDFTLSVVLQVVLYCLYFPDGELYGQRTKSYVSNRNSYNEKAVSVNQRRLIGKLREYCKFEFEQRKEAYILNECGFIGITKAELDFLREKSEKEIKRLEHYEFEEFDEDGKSLGSKMVFFNRQKRKRLHKLLFKPIPVEENHPETILSAVENNSNRAIRDGSISYKAKSYVRKFFTALVVGGILAYIGYTVRDGVGLTEVVTICMFLTTMFTTAVMAFTSGETCSKVYKNRFYLDLGNYLDGFFEWAKLPPEIEEKEVEAKSAA